MVATLLVSWWHSNFETDNDLMLMVADCQERLRQLPHSTEAVDKVAALIEVIHADYLRSQSRKVLTQAQLSQQHRTTFMLSLDLLFAAL